MFAFVFLNESMIIYVLGITRMYYKYCKCTYVVNVRDFWLLVSLGHFQFSFVSTFGFLPLFSFLFQKKEERVEK